MALTLVLTDGNTSVDFNTTNYELLADGLVISFPELSRADTGDNLLTEGVTVGEYKYSTRTIDIQFRLKGADHDEMLSNLQAILQLLDNARSNARDSIGSPVVLQYKPDNASSTVEFNILSGTLAPINFGSPLVRRDALISDAHLTLEARPYAQLTTEQLLMNTVQNPFFSYNPGRMAISGRWHDIGGAGTGNYYQHTTPTNFIITTGAPMQMMLSTFFQHKTGSISADEIIVTCGITNKSYELKIDANEAVVFTWWNAAGTPTTVTSPNSLIADTIDHHVAALIYKNQVGSGAGSLMTVLMVDGKIVAQTSGTTANMYQTPNTAFRVGEGNGANHANIYMHSLYITKGVAMLPQDAYHCYLWGHHGLARLDISRGVANLSTETLPLAHDHWFLLASQFIGGWNFEDTGATILDRTGNSRDLSEVGSVSVTNPQPQIPCGWTAGSAIGQNEGLVFPPAVQLDEPAFGGTVFAVVQIDGAYNANRYFESNTITVPTDRTNIGHTWVVWLRKSPIVTGAQTVDVSYYRNGVAVSSVVTIPDDSEWHQFALKLQTGVLVDGDTFKLRIGRHITSGGTNCQILIGPCALYLQTAYGDLLPGKSSATVYELTGNERLPIVDHYAVYATRPEVQPGGYRNNCFTVMNPQGDAPAACKLIIRNVDSSQGYPFLAVGCRTGQYPHHQLFHLPMLQIADPDTGAAYDLSVTPEGIKGPAGRALQRLGYLSLASLLPFPEKQVGTHKIYITGKNAYTGALFVGSVRSGAQQVFLTGDPVKSVTTDAALRDIGLLGWPSQDNAAAMSPRTTAARPPEPVLEISTLAGTSTETNTAWWYDTYLLPVDGGSALFCSNTASGAYPGQLLPGEEFVIDTIDPKTPTLYFTRTELRPGATGSQATRSGNSTAADVSFIGEGFYPIAGKGTVFSFVGGREGSTLFGENSGVQEIHVYFIYKPRFLLV